MFLTGVGRFNKGFKPESNRCCTNYNLLLDHRHTECPAKDQICNNCGKKGHYALVVGQRVGIVQVEIQLDVQAVVQAEVEVESPIDENSCNDNSRDCDSAQFCSIDCNVSDETEWYIDLDVNGHPINFKIDSGADVTVISEDVYRKMPNRPCLKPIKVVLNSPGGQLSNLGQFVARTLYKGEKFHFLVQVVKGTTTSLLGQGPCVSLGLIATIFAVEAHSRPEPGKGTLKGNPVKIVLKENAQPYSVSTERRVPIPLMPKVKAELERMERECVISRADRVVHSHGTHQEIGRC